MQNILYKQRIYVGGSTEEGKNYIKTYPVGKYNKN